MVNQIVINRLLTFSLAGVFLLSAISKLIAPGLFEITILDQGIIESREVAAYFGRFLIILELFLGIALLQPYYQKRIILPASLLTLIGFTILLLFSHFAGDTENCGCFGEVIKMSPLEAIIKNIIFIVVGLFIFRSLEDNNKRLYIPTIILIITSLFVFFVAPIKSYEDLKFSQYTNFENEGRVDLTDGNKLVVIFFIDCEHCIEIANEIGKLENETSNFDNLYILFSGEEGDSVQHFLDKTELQHPYLRIPIDDFFDLIGSAPPRIYWLQNGKVKEYWDDNFKNNLIRFQSVIKK